MLVVSCLYIGPLVSKHVDCFIIIIKIIVGDMQITDQFSK